MNQTAGRDLGKFEIEITFPTPPRKTSNQIMPLVICFDAGSLARCGNWLQCATRCMCSRQSIPARACGMLKRDKTSSGVPSRDMLEQAIPKRRK